jgi:hypothetical protein
MLHVPAETNRTAANHPPIQLTVGESPPPSSSALFWYQHWSTRALNSVSLMALLLLGILSRQSVYGLIAVFQLMFPWMRLVIRGHDDDHLPAAGRSTLLVQPHCDASQGSSTSGERAASSAPRTQPSAPATDSQENPISVSQKKLIYLPSRPEASRALMVVALVHLAVTTLGGVLVPSVPFLQAHYPVLCSAKPNSFTEAFQLFLGCWGLS